MGEQDVKRVKVLILEDVPTDAELMERALRKGGLQFTACCVDQQEPFERALEEFAPDIVLSDYNLPDLNGAEALQIVKRLAPGIPVIVVTGALGDEAAADLIRAGARDYLLKDRLERLPLAVTRVLLENEQARARDNAEEALRESEARHRALIETSSDWIWEGNARGELTYSSPRASKLLGYTWRELKGRPFLSLVSKADEPRIRKNFEAVSTNETGFMLVECTMVGKQGQEIVFESSGQPFFDHEGVLKGFRGISRDITERKQAEKERLMQAAVISAVQETSLDGILVVGPGARILTYNKRFLDVFHVPPEELASGDDAPVLGIAKRAALDPEGFAKRVEYIYTQPDLTSRDEIPTKDGRVFDRYSSPVRLGDGSLAGRVWFFRDITDQKRAEQSLREGEARFRALVEQAIAGVFILGATGEILYVNPGFAGMFGYTPEEVIGKPFSDFVVGETKDAVAESFASQIAGGAGPRQTATALKRKDGGHVDVLAHGAPTVLDGKPVVIGVLLDLSEQKNAERALQRAYRTLMTLSEGNEALIRATSEQDLLSAMCVTIVKTGGYRMAWIGVPLSDEPRTISPVASAGDDTGYLKAVTVTWADGDERGRGITGAAVRTGQPQTNQNFATDERMSVWRQEAQRHGFASSAALPLIERGHVFAVLTIYSGEVDAFTGDELKLLQQLANNVAYGITALRVHAEREAAIQRWRTSLVSTIEAIASTTEMRDPYTAGHQHRVAQLAVAIARELQLSEEQVRGIELAGLIHDVGKITVPAELLTKPGKLTPLEFQLIQTHAQSGFDVVKGVDFPWPIAQAILQHHERLDGSGYPNQLKGDEILREARILAVADVVEAMMSHRPYRAALGLDAALDEIQSGKGRLYDPEAAEACVRLFREKGFSLA